jgi:hypothetical protein
MWSDLSLIDEKELLEKKISILDASERDLPMIG